MSDAYQAVYDATRSKLGNCDIGSAVENAFREASLSHYADMAYRALSSAASEYERAAAVFKPRLFIDGNQWCALYGENLQEGVAGFGDSPASAMWDFDKNWSAKLPGKGQP